MVEVTDAPDLRSNPPDSTRGTDGARMHPADDGHPDARPLYPRIVTVQLGPSGAKGDGGRTPVKTSRLRSRFVAPVDLGRNVIGSGRCR